MHTGSFILYPKCGMRGWKTKIFFSLFFFFIIHPVINFHFQWIIWKKPKKKKKFHSSIRSMIQIHIFDIIIHSLCGNRLIPFGLAIFFFCFCFVDEFSIQSAFCFRFIYNSSSSSSWWVRFIQVDEFYPFFFHSLITIWILSMILWWWWWLRKEIFIMKTIIMYLVILSFFSLQQQILFFYLSLSFDLKGLFSIHSSINQWWWWMNEWKIPL